MSEEASAASVSVELSDLPDELQAKAEKELGEKKSWRQRDIDALRDVIKARHDLYCPHEDDTFLLMFLRGKKFDYDAAAKLIERYYQVRLEYKSFYELFRPSALLKFYEDGALIKLPKISVTDPQPILLRPAAWDPSCNTMEDMFKANLIQIEKLIRVEENQINGFVFMIDMGGMTWNHAKNMNPLLAKKFTSILQHAMPVRLKGLHYINVPHFFEYLFGMIRPFLSEKMQQRRHVHSNPDGLKEHFDVKVIPKYLGGELEIDDLVKEWALELKSSEQEFKDREKYGLKEVTTLSSNDKKCVDPIGGITGTFRKLYTWE